MCALTGFLLISSLTNQPACAQVDSSLGFFSIHSGDFRQYNYGYYIYCYNQHYSTYYSEYVRGDTVLSTGFRYKIISSLRSPPPPERYVRLDSATANAYEYSSFGDYLLDSLRATTGSIFRKGYGGMPVQCTSVDTATVLGRHTTVKRFNALITGGGWSYSLAHGFGLVRNITQSEDFCYPVWNSYVTTLPYARIDGEEYGTFVGVGIQNPTTPTSYALEQNYPNPFNPATTITFDFPERSHATLVVYDLLGRQVSFLVDGVYDPGRHDVSFNGTSLGSGVYFYRLNTNGFVQTRKMILQK